MTKQTDEGLIAEIAKYLDYIPDELKPKPNELVGLLQRAHISLIRNHDKQEWVSVEDRLPDRYEKVLVAQDTDAVFIAMWEDKDWWLSANDLEIETPAHWQPLPSPPEE